MKNILILSVLLLAGLKQHAQSFYDLNTVQTIQIVFTQSNWDQLLDAEAAGAGDDPSLPFIDRVAAFESRLIDQAMSAPSGPSAPRGAMLALACAALASRRRRRP